MRALLLAGVFASSVGSVEAATITFETAPFGNLYDPVSEAGFTYSFPNRDAFIDSAGHPGQDIEGRISLAGTSGQLTIVPNAGSSPTFTFQRLDFSAYSSIPGDPPTQTLYVTGIRNGAVVGIDSYTLANTSVYLPGSGSDGTTYANWTTETALNLSGVVLDTLQIGLSGKIGSSGNRALNVDNVVLTPLAASVPEPTSLALLGLGAGFAGFLARRRKTTLPDQRRVAEQSSCEIGLRHYASLARGQGNSGSATLLSKAADLISRDEQNQSTAAALLIFSMVAEEEGKTDLGELLTAAASMLYQNPAYEQVCNTPAVYAAA